MLAGHFYSPAPNLPMPAWVRVILFAVSADLPVQIPASILADTARVDADDVAAARSGDGDAYARIIRRHQAMVARRMLRFSRDRGVVEELVHDCFVDAYLSLKNYRGDAPLEHWLAKIATRVGYRHWKLQRRNRARLSKLQSNAAASVSVTLADGDAGEMAAHLLEKLSPRDRLAITLIYIEGHSIAQAAEMAGWSQTMMKVQAFRARGKLRAILKEEGVDHG